jgi:hypothetical protein
LPPQSAHLEVPLHGPCAGHGKARCAAWQAHGKPIGKIGGRCVTRLHSSPLPGAPRRRRPNRALLHARSRAPGSDDEASHPPKRCATILGGPPAPGPELRLEHAWANGIDARELCRGRWAPIRQPTAMMSVHAAERASSGRARLRIGRSSLPARSAGRLCFRAA